MATRYNQAQIDKIRARNAGKSTSTASPVTKVQTSSMNKPTSPSSVMQTGVVTEKGIVKTPVTNVASNAPISVPKVTASTPVKPTFVPTRQAKEQYWDLVNKQQQAGQFDAGTQVRMADEAMKREAAQTGQITFDTAGLFGETTAPTSPTSPTAPTSTAPTPTGVPAEMKTTEMAAPTEVIPSAAPVVSEPTGIAGVTKQAGAGMTAAATQYLQKGQEMAAKTYSAAEDARRLDMISALNATNARELADTMGVKLENMTTAQLEQLSVASGLQPDTNVINRIKEEGSLAIDDIRMERGDVLAENKFTREQTERIFDRALDDRERFNAAQDVKLKNAMATLGGGTTSQGSLIEVMAAQEQGRRALEDLSKEYAGRVDAIGRQAQAIVREYGAIERQINFQVNSAVEAKYAEMQNTLKELRKQGVTNKKDLNAAMLPLMKEYVNFYNDAVKWQAEQMFEVQKEANDEAERIFRRGFDLDKEMSQQTGVVYTNGQPLLDTEGNPIPTLSGLRDISAIDYQQSQMTGFVHKNGAMVLDANGNPVPTAEIMKFQTTEDRLRDQFDQELGFQMSKEQFDQKMQAAKFAQSQLEFEQITGMKLTEQGWQQLKYEAELLDKGYQVGVIVNTQSATPSFNPAKSVYGIIPTQTGGISIQAPYTGNASTGTAVLKSNRRQCGEYVNDVIGIPSYFGDEFSQKKSRVTTQVPSPGSAFVLDVGTPHGHVGIVEEVYPDGTLLISESNKDDTKRFYRGRVSIENLRQRGLVGFTGGLMTEKKIQKMPGVLGVSGGMQTGQPAPGMTTAGKPQTEGQSKTQGFAERLINAEKAMREVAGSVETEAQNARIGLELNPVTGFGLGKGLLGGVLTGRNLPGFLQGKEIQQQLTAERDFITAVLRKESGAAITDEEFRQFSGKFFPEPGDTPERIAQKAQLRQQEIMNMQREAGLNPTGLPTSIDKLLQYTQNIGRPFTP